MNQSTSTCPDCGVQMVVGDWPWCPHGRHTFLALGKVSSREAAVVYENPLTGEIRIPMRNDRPTPDRLTKHGFVRRELRSINDLREVERRTGTQSEALHCDPGTGTHLGDETDPPTLTEKLAALGTTVTTDSAGNPTISRAPGSDPMQHLTD